MAPVIWATTFLRIRYVYCQAVNCILETNLTLPVQLVIMNLFAGNRDLTVFDRPDEYLPERWLDGRKGRTDMLGEGGDKLGVPHLTYGAGRRVHPLSGQPRSLLVACTSPAFLHLGATTSWRGGEEARLPSLPC